MLSKTIIATAILAGASAVSAKGAVVRNACEYPVKLCSVPAQYGGYEETDKTLAANETYSQDWLELTNGAGWSIKLSPNDNLDHILQYEYTFHNDGIIWYDLSEVDGNPWDGNWEITSDNTECTPKQQAYRYATDDAYGMQSCPEDVTITVTLCSGESQNDGAASSIASSVVSATSTQSYQASSASSYVVPASTSESVAASSTESSVPAVSPIPASVYSSSEESSTSTYSRHWWTEGNVAQASTTLATLASTTTEAAGTVVTNVVTEYVTAYATATAYAKRDQPQVHRHGHPHVRA